MACNYNRMLDMTEDSHLFCTREELEEQKSAWLINGNCYKNESDKWLPLYEGKMIQIYNHRYANVRTNLNNVSSQGVPTS